MSRDTQPSKEKGLKVTRADGYGAFYGGWECEIKATDRPPA